MVCNGLRRKGFTAFYETIIVEDGTDAYIRCESFNNPHAPRLDIRREGQRAFLYGNPTQ